MYSMISMLSIFLICNYKYKVDHTYPLKLLRMDEDLEVLKRVVAVGVEVGGSVLENKSLEVCKVVFLVSRDIVPRLADQRQL